MYTFKLLKHFNVFGYNDSGMIPDFIQNPLDAPGCSNCLTHIHSTHTHNTHSQHNTHNGHNGHNGHNIHMNAHTNGFDSKHPPSSSTLKGE